MSLTKGDITFLFDEGVTFKESYEFACADPTETMRRLKKVAQVRSSLLAANVQIIRLNVKGVKQENVRMLGVGDTCSNSRMALRLREDGKAYRRRLRGVPETAYKVGIVSSQASNALREFNRVLAGCQCQFKTTLGTIEPIKNLEIVDWTVLSWKSARKLPKRRLILLLGVDEGTQMFEKMKSGV